MAVDLSMINQLYPLKVLTEKNKKELALSSNLQVLESGTLLFDKGDSNNDYYYLIEGVVKLKDKDNVVKVLDTNDSGMIVKPIEDMNPRKYAATVEKPSTILKLEKKTIDMMAVWEKTGTFEVEEIQVDLSNVESGDWMSSVLTFNVFDKLSPDKLQDIYTKIEKIDTKPKQEVISQGDKSDGFYVVLRGKYLVLRTTTKNPKGIKLGVLNPGDSFGSDSIITGDERNASVVGLNEGTVIKISTEDFINTVLESKVNDISFNEMEEMVKSKKALVLDIRNPDEYAKKNYPESINIPLLLMRLKTPRDKTKKFICYCNNGKRSKAACFILNDKGLDAFYLKNDQDKICS